MPLHQPGSINPESFAYSDLWQETMSLAGLIRGVHVDRLGPAEEGEPGIQARVEYASAPHETEFKAYGVYREDDPRAMERAHRLATQAMGNRVWVPRNASSLPKGTYDIYRPIRDRNPLQTRKPQQQREQAQFFLNFATQLDAVFLPNNYLNRLELSFKLSDAQEGVPEAHARLARLAVRFSTLAGVSGPLYADVLRAAEEKDGYQDLPWLRGRSQR